MQTGAKLLYGSAHFGAEPAPESAGVRHPGQVGRYARDVYAGAQTARRVRRRMGDAGQTVCTGISVNVRLSESSAA